MSLDFIWEFIFRIQKKSMSKTVCAMNFLIYLKKSPKQIRSSMMMYSSVCPLIMFLISMISVIILVDRV